MRIAVVGAGAMGCLFGGYLASRGHEVWLIHPRAEHVAALNQAGLRIEGIGGDRRIPVHATTSPAEVGSVDLVIVLVKSPQTRVAAAAAGPLVGPETMVLTLQNGLGNREALAEHFGERRVAVGLTYNGAALVGAGHIRFTSMGHTFLGAADPQQAERLQPVVEALASAGLPTSATERLEEMVWGKLVVNATLNATSALTGCNGDQLRASPAAREWLTLVARETEAVARALGIELPYPDAAERVLRHLVVIGAGRPSMLQDFDQGRWTEVDAINGAVVRAGERCGVATPYNRALLLLVRSVEDRQHSAADNPAQ